MDRPKWRNLVYSERYEEVSNKDRQTRESGLGGQTEMEEFSPDVDNQMEELSLCAFAVLMEQIKSRRVEAPFMAFFCFV